MDIWIFNIIPLPLSSCSTSCELILGPTPSLSLISQRHTDDRKQTETETETDNQTREREGGSGGRSLYLRPCQLLNPMGRFVSVQHRYRDPVFPVDFQKRTHSAGD